MIPKKLEMFRKFDKRAIKNLNVKTCSVNGSKTTSPLPNLGVVASMKSEADALCW